MISAEYCRRLAALVVSGVLLGANVAWATSGAWEGDTSLYWTNNNNWANNYTYPSASDTATFNSTGNNRTNINIAGLSRIKYITFDTYNVAWYQIGTMPASSQTLVIDNSGLYRITASAGNNQTINAAVQIGTDRSAYTYTFQNDSPSYSLNLEGDILTPASGGTAGTKTIAFNGVGDIRVSGNILTNGLCPIYIDKNGNGVLTLSGSNHVTRIDIDGSPNSVVDIGNNGYLFLDNLGSTTIYATQDAVIKGRGTIRLGTNTGENGADCYVAAGKTLVINPDLVSDGVFEMWSGTGTFVFNGNNDFRSNILMNTSGAISVSKIGNVGELGNNFGTAPIIKLSGSGCRLIYTGEGESSDRLLQLNNNATLDHSGSGELIFTRDLSVGGNTKTLTLSGSASGVGEIAGTISAGSATTSLAKDGSGTWRLSANNTFAGSTTVRNGTLILTGSNGAAASSSGYTVNFGATLRLANTAAANNGNRLKDSGGVTLNGGTLHFANDGGDASYSEAVATLSIAQNACTVRADRAPAAQTSTLTFAALSRTAGATVNFVGEGLGDADGRNKIVITAQAEGVIGSWATVNGTNLAAYSAALGVYPAPEFAYDADIAARGPSSVIVSNDASNVRINAAGVDGPIQLGSTVTRIFSLTQNTGVDATVDTAGKTLQAAGINVPGGRASVTVGVAPGEGALTALTPGGDLTLNSGETSGGLTVNAGIANNGSASTITKLGDGTVTLAAPGTFSGLTAIGGGTLLLKSADALQNSTLSGYGVVFDESVSGHAFALGGLTGSFPLTLEDNGATPGAVNLTVGRNNLNASYNGVLSGLGGLTKTGTATQTLSGSNTFSGGLTVGQGSLTASAVGALGAAPVVNNGTLNLTAGSVNYTGLSAGLSGTGTVNVTLSTGANSTYLQGDYSGFSGIWNIGIGAAANAGKAYMTGADNGDATINVLSNASLFCNNAGTHLAKVVLKGGNTGEPYGQLRLENNCVWAGPVTLAGDITSGDDGFVGGSSGTGYISGNIGDLDSTPHPFYKIGANTITLTGDSTFKGPIWIRNGTLSFNSAANVGSASSALGAPGTVADGTIKFGANNTNTVLTYIGNGSETDRNLELAGTTGSATVDQSGTNLLKFTGAVSSSAAGLKKLTLQGSNAAGEGEMAGVISDGLAGATICVLKSGSGTWTLSGDNTFSGGITNNGGTLVVAHPHALGTAGVGVNSGVVATFDLAHDGEDDRVQNWRMYDTATCTIRANRGTEGPGINHAIGTAQLSGITLHATNGLNVTSGTPTLTIETVDLFGGSANKVTTLVPTTADLIIGRAAIYENNFANKTLKLDGTSTGSMILGSVSNGLNTVLLRKSNTGTWTLYGSNIYSGATTVDGGSLVLTGPGGAILGTSGITLSGNATLALRNSADTNNANRLSDAASLTMNGGLFEYAHSGGAADYSESVGPLVVSGGSNTLATARADESQTSALTFASLSRTGTGTLNFAGDGLGDADGRNRVLFSSEPALANGLIGPWAMINGTALATYDSTLGVTVYTNYTDIAARGPDSVVPDDASLNARINTAGVDGPIILGAASVSSVNSLLQNTDTPAKVAMTDTVLRASALLLGAGKADLTLGTAENEGAVSALTAGGQLLVVNHDASAVLTINAPVADNGSASALVKSGDGVVVLAGLNTYSGATVIDQGTLAFGGTGTQTVTSVISGPGKLSKTGTGRVVLAGANTFTGETSINEGIFVVKNNAAFGSSAAGTFVEDGATLDIGGGLGGNAVNLGTEVFTIRGTGFNDMGAIANETNITQISAFGRVVLAGDTTVSAYGRWDIRQNTPSLAMNGHTLTKVGGSELCLVSCWVTPAGGHIVVTQGIFRLESSARLNGDATDTLRVKPGAKLDMWGFTSDTNASPWTLICEDLASVTAGSGVHPQNTWWGPVTLEGTALLDCSSGRSMTFTNAISGSGSLVKNNTGDAYVFGGANTYTGLTIVSNGFHHVFQPGGLPGYNENGRVVVGPSGTLVTYFADDGSGWTKEQIDDVRTNAAFMASTAGLGINTAWGDLVYDRDLVAPMSFVKYGTNSLTFPGQNLFGGTLKVYGGTMNLSATSSNAIGAVNVYGGSLGATLNIDGYTELTYGTANMTLGAAGNDRSVVVISTNAAMGKLLVGTTKAGSAAVIQNGGDLIVGAHLSGTDVTSIGTGGGYGYYRLNKGSLRTGQLALTGGGSGNNDGVFELYDGSVNLPTNGGWLIWGWAGGNGVLNMFGGKLESPKNGNDPTFAYAANRSTFGMLNLLGTAAFFDSTGQNTGKSINMARNAGNIAAVVNLNAGTILANRIYASVTGTPSLFNFGGGTLKVNPSTGSASAFMQGLTAATVYPGGAVIDTTNVNITVNQPLLGAVGYGVASIPLRSQGLGYIGAPTVVISGGSGTGATAIASVDLNESSPTFRQVTGITVTSPGSGYQPYDGLTVTLRGGGYTNYAGALASAPVLAPNGTDGGLTKLGSGTLTLGGVNTYSGDTVISNGTVKLGNASALPAASDIVLAGGTLDLGGCTVTNSISGFGAVTNGTLQTVISPAGENAIGDDTFALNGTILQGVYLADVTEAGASDHVTFLGDADLSGLSLELVDPDKLVRSQQYVIATVTGPRSGTFAPVNLPDARWRVIYGEDGTVKLIFVDGTILMLK